MFPVSQRVESQSRHVGRQPQYNQAANSNRGHDDGSVLKIKEDQVTRSCLILVHASAVCACSALPRLEMPAGLGCVRTRHPRQASKQASKCIMIFSSHSKEAESRRNQEEMGDHDETESKQQVAQTTQPCLPLLVSFLLKQALRPPQVWSQRHSRAPRVPTPLASDPLRLV